MEHLKIMIKFKIYYNSHNCQVNAMKTHSTFYRATLNLDIILRL